MHCISTATLGAFLGMAKFSKGSFSKLFPVIGLLTAMIFHFMWNASVSFEETYYLGFLFMIILVVSFFLVFKLSLNHEEKIITDELSEESVNGVLPAAHTKILSSHLRFSKGWIDEKIRKRYSRYAVRLAFSKDQLKKVKLSEQKYYEAEIEKYREEIRNLLSNKIVEG
jgi:protease PrsW